jgi:hypothetical protein
VNHWGDSVVHNVEVFIDFVPFSPSASFHDSPLSVQVNDGAIYEFMDKWKKTIGIPR